MPRARQAIPPLDTPHKCRFCQKGFTEASRVRLHVKNTPDCRHCWESLIASYSRLDVEGGVTWPDAMQGNGSAFAHAGPSTQNGPYRDVEMADAEMLPPAPIPDAFMNPVESTFVNEGQHSGSMEGDLPLSPEGDFTRVVEEYPREVSEVHGEGLTLFEQWRKEELETGQSRWAPFQSEDEWDLVSWMGRNLGHNQIEEFLKLRTVQGCDLSVGSKYTFFQKVDALPVTQNWLYTDVKVVGDLKGEDGKPMTERLELWRRDPLECVRELIGNPEFRESMKYTPEKVFADMGQNVRIYDEMWTGEWWWHKQEELPADATIAPIILASDKTKLTQFCGDQTAWPVYLSIGNIAKATRRQVSTRATVLVGYIPVSKLECFAKGPNGSNRALASYRLFHRCMRKILEPLIEAGKSGVEMLCADGRFRKVYPILAAYVADHPEQCLVVNVKENCCPKGKVQPGERGELSECVLRKVDEVIEALNKHKKGESDEAVFEASGLRPVYNPFWKDFPHCDMFDSISPDILHQLHKGVFKDHLMAWLTRLLTEEEIDRRFKAIPQMPGLRYFKKGISGVSQWTGKEHKEMQKVVVAMLSGAVSAEVHTDVTLERLREALEAFHANKEVFVRLGIREHFNIPKLHSLLHYLEYIRSRGCLDGFNTELSERLHIDFAKEGFRAGNHHDYVACMIIWLVRQEKIHLRERYLDWLFRQEHEEDPQHSSEDDTIPVEVRAEPTTPQTDVAFVEEEDNDNEEGDDNGDNDKDIRVHRTSSSHRGPQLTGVTVTAYRRDLSTIPRHILAKKCAFLRRDAQHLKTYHGASQFHEAIPTWLTRYDVYRQVKILRPWNPITGDTLVYDRIRAIPEVPAAGRKAAVPSAFDTALIVENRELYEDAPAGSLIGLRAARVRVIFKTPPQFLLLGCRQEILAYVEWYTPFTRIDHAVHMYYVARSTRHNVPNASIVPVQDIIAPCHLIPRCNQKIDPSWSSENVLECATHFYVNPYISIDTFSTSGLYTKYS
ncbi:hypothetical protein K474DRAFT_1712310 [Panus rudis PR-1116 ss-1]|nr:hypothetical protein K474DRAFT_1712310 [Panus rudis PR-1116 ss-1]